MRLANILLITLLLFIVVATTVSASTVTVTPINDSSNHIFFDETAQFEAVIYNSLSEAQVFSLNVNPLEWVLQSSSSVRVSPGETKIIPVHIRPRQSNYRGAGYYEVPIEIRPSAEEAINANTNIYIRSVSSSGYSPHVLVGASIDKAVDPRKPVDVQVSLRSQNVLDLEDIEIVIDGDNFYVTDSVDLAGLEQKFLEYRFDVDPLLGPEEYELLVRANYNGKVLGEVTRHYAISPYFSSPRETVSDDTVFFKHTKVTSITNDANIVRTIPLDLDINWYQRPFTKVSIEASHVEKTDASSWDLLLQPREEIFVTVVQNYRIVPLIIALAIIAVLLYFMLRTPIKLSKHTFITGKDAEGISEMKVRVYIRNRTGKTFYNVRLLDKVPSIAKVSIPSGLGIMQPTDVVKTQKKGTIIKYDFETLEAFEERILTYTIKAKLKIIGHLGLPSVKARFETVKGKQRTTISGKSQIGAKS